MTVEWSHDQPEDSAGFLLWQVTNQWQRKLRAVLAPLGLTHVQFVLLAGLAWQEGQGLAPTQTQLAAFCKTDEMMTSQVVRALEREGLIERRRHPSDTRARQLGLTARGGEMIAKAVPVVEKADRDFFAALGREEKPFTAALLRLRTP